MKMTVRNLVSAAVVFGTVALTTTGAWAADGEAGKAIYMAKCKTCHGAEGTPAPAMAKALGTKPLGDADIQAKSDADMKTAVTKGVGKMKPVAGVAGADLDNVVAFVRTFKK